MIIYNRNTYNNTQKRNKIRKREEKINSLELETFGNGTNKKTDTVLYYNSDIPISTFNRFDL